MLLILSTVDNTSIHIYIVISDFIQSTVIFLYSSKNGNRSKKRFLSLEGSFIKVEKRLLASITYDTCSHGASIVG